MSRFAKKAVILSVIFLLAVGGYFIWNQKHADPDIFYTSIEDANLPVVYMEMYGEAVNGLHGYFKEDSRAAAREALTVLPADRRLGIRIGEADGALLGIQYEVRNLERSRLLEKTQVSDWTQADGYTRAELPIENLLTKDEEYLLTIQISFEGQKPVYYCTRILWTDSPYAEQMISLAKEFSAKTFDYGEAQTLTTYLESSDSADNSSLGVVTLKSSFSQLVWANLDMTVVSPVSVTLKDLQGIMGNVQLDYMVARTPESGPEELYEISENFTMKWSEQRIYMMDYERRMNQVFEGDSSLFSGKRIILGIQDGEGIQTMTDPAGAYQAFVVGRELWCLDRQENRAVRVFTFRDGVNENSQGNYKKHGVKILSVNESGDVSFLVYGYMNRGNHEGTTGVSMYRYDNGSNTIVEKFYIPEDEPCEMLAQDLNRFSYLTAEDVVYMYLGGTIYSVNLMSGEASEVARGLSADELAVSESGSRLAWQEEDGKVIRVMDLKSGRTDEIRAGQGGTLRVLGFVGSDLVYGLAAADSDIVENGRVTGTAMYALEIVSDTMEVATRYEKDGLYITDVTISDSRVHMRRIAKSGGGYADVDEDTLVCNEEIGGEASSGIGWFASDERRRVYFVQVDQGIESGRRIRLLTPRKMVAEEANTVEMAGGEQSGELVFCAYGRGRYLGCSRNFTEAVGMAYDAMGMVTDENGRVVWNRVNRGNIRTLGDVEAQAAGFASILREFDGTRRMDDGSLILDCRGLSIPQILYFIDRGNLVAGYTEGGAYLLIYGFDPYNISVYDPASGSTFKMGLNDSEAYFKSFGNDFICVFQRN